MRQTVTQNASWSLDGLDPDVRDAAREAARRAGMTLDEWLSAAVAERASRVLSREPVRRRAPPPGYEDLDGAAARLDKATRGARAAQPSRNLDGVIANLAAEQDRRVRESAAKTAEALDSVARWIERAEDRMSETTRVVAERQDRTATVLGEALALMTRRLDDIERKVADGRQPSVDAALKAVEKVERHLARFEEQRREGGDADAARVDARVAEALSGFETRIATIAERLAETARPAPIGRRGASVREELKEAVAEIRSRQAALEGGDPAYAPAYPPARAVAEPQRSHADVLASLRGDIAKLAGQLDTLRPRGAEAPAVESVRAEIAELQERVGRLATREEVGALEQVLRDLAREASQTLIQARLGQGTSEAAAMGATLARLESEVRRLSEEVARATPASFAGAFEELAHKIDLVADAGVDPRVVQALAGELGELRAVLGEIAEPSRVDGLAEQVAELSRQVARVARAQIDPLELASMRTAIEEIRGAVAAERAPAPGPDLSAVTGRLDGLAETIAAAAVPREPDLSAITGRLDGLAERLDAVAAPAPAPDLSAIVGRVDALGEKLEAVTGLLSRADLGALGRDIEGIAASAAKIGKRAESADLKALSAQIEALNGRLDALAGREGPDLSPVARQIEALERRLAERPAEPPPPAALVARLDVIADKLDGIRAAPPAPPLDVSGLMRRFDRIEESLARPRPGPDLEPLEALLGDLARKIDARRDGDGLDGLERQIAEIAARLDRDRAPDPGLASLERTMGDLMAQIEGLKDGVREGAAEAAAEAAERAARAALEGGRAPRAEAPDGALALLERSLADLKAAQGDAERRSRDTLSAVHGTLEALVAKLSAIEAGGPRAEAPRRPREAEAPAGPRGRTRGGEERPREEAPPADRLAARAQAIGAGRSPNAGALLAEADAPVAPAPTLDEILLEPGSGRPLPETGRARAPEPEAGDIKASFIAAARRAAQSAAAEAAAAAKRDAAPEGAPASGAAGFVKRVRAAVERRRKPLLLGLAAIVLALGALQIGTRGGGEDAPQAAVEAPAPAILPAPPAAPAAATPPAEAPARPDPATTQSIPTRPDDGASLFAPSPQAAAASTIPADDLVIPAPISGTLGAPLPPRRDGAAPALAAALPTLPPTPVGPVDPTALAGLDLPATAGPARLREAARAGDLAAVHELAARLADGRGAARDPALAARLFERAAERGLVPAQYRIGQIYDKGLGVARDPQAAERWYRSAAERGNVTAMHNLAVLLAEGVGGQPDYVGAIGWFRRAAEHGVRDSQYNLAVLLARGLGAPQDLKASFVWFAVAAAGGDADAAARRDEVGRRLSPEELVLATSAAESWRPQIADPDANEVAIPAQGWDDRSARHGAPAARA